MLEAFKLIVRLIDMTRKKNLCQKCGVRHGAATGKKYARLEADKQIVSELQEGTVTNGLQASPPVKDRHQWWGRVFRCFLSLNMDKLFHKVIIYH